MGLSRLLHAVAAAAIVAAGPRFAIAADAARGAQLFRQCAACHSVQPGEHLTGPSLADAWHRKAGTAPGFLRYSDALKRSGIAWDEASLDRWLADPAALVPGTSMTFPGLRDEQARGDLIAYLQAVSEKKAPAARPGRGGAMGMSRAKPDLKRAPLAGQVVSVGHCGDTYTVKTADGRTEKVWEFNLRFKTDSSALGPALGKPVIIGAGMQGDRASVVFARPKEISEFVVARCP